MKYLFLLWNIYFGYKLLKIGLNIHNLYYFYWYTLTSHLFSHFWIILIHAYNFKYMFLTPQKKKNIYIYIYVCVCVCVFLTLLKPNYLNMHFIIWYLKIITHRIIQVRKMYQLFIFQCICIQLDKKSQLIYIYIYIYIWMALPKKCFLLIVVFFIKKYNNNNN